MAFGKVFMVGERKYFGRSGKIFSEHTTHIKPAKKVSQAGRKHVLCKRHPKPMSEMESAWSFYPSPTFWSSLDDNLARRSTLFNGPWVFGGNHGWPQSGRGRKVFPNSGFHVFTIPDDAGAQAAFWVTSGLSISETTRRQDALKARN